jgi:hypothetical protein
MRPLDLALDCCAAYRLTRLVVADKITLPFRAALIRTAYAWRDGGIGDAWHDATDEAWDMRAHDDVLAPKLATLVTCPYCVGVYVAAGVGVARRYVRGWDPVARALTVAAAAALLKGLERDD